MTQTYHDAAAGRAVDLTELPLGAAVTVCKTNCTKYEESISDSIAVIQKSKENNKSFRKYISTIRIAGVSFYIMLHTLLKFAVSNIKMHLTIYDWS